MKASLIAGVAILGVMCLFPAPATAVGVGGTELAYMVVCQNDVNGQETYSVMSREDFEKAWERTKKMPECIRLALEAAQNEWKSAERARVKGKDTKQTDPKKKDDNEENKAQPFPSLDINTEPSIKCLKACETEAEAQEVCERTKAAVDEQKKKRGVGKDSTTRLSRKLSASGLSKPSSSKQATDKNKEKDAENKSRAEREKKAMEMFKKYLAVAEKRIDDGVTGMDFSRSLEWTRHGDDAKKPEKKKRSLGGKIEGMGVDAKGFK